MAPVHEFPLEQFWLLPAVMLEARLHGIPPHRVVTDIMLTEPAVRRLIEPAEVAELVAFLCSDHASFANGASWLLDGGWTAR